MAKGYTDTDRVAAMMGASFSADQTLIANLAIGAAEAWIDHNIKHAWLEPPDAQITEEIVLTRTSLVRVQKPPVLSFDTVSVVWWPGIAAAEMPPNVGAYFVRSMRDGVLWVPWASGAYSIVAVYTPNDDPVPDEVQLAAATLAAATLRMIPVFNDDVDPTLVQRYSVGGELEVEFRKTINTAGVATQQALTYMDSWVKGYAIV